MFKWILSLFQPAKAKFLGRWRTLDAINYTTYSFVDSSLTIIASILGAPFISGGEQGFHQAVVSMAIDRTVHDVASDGGVMVSAVPGSPGTITVECQQTSTIHKYLLGWLNAITVAMLAGNVTNFANTTVLLRNITDGSQHVCTGVSPSKMPDKTYSTQGQHVTWTLHCADIQNTSF